MFRSERTGCFVRNISGAMGVAHVASGRKTLDYRRAGNEPQGKRQRQGQRNHYHWRQILTGEGSLVAPSRRRVGCCFDLSLMESAGDTSATSFQWAVGISRRVRKSFDVCDIIMEPDVSAFDRWYSAARNIPSNPSSSSKKTPPTLTLSTPFSPAGAK